LEHKILEPFREQDDADPKATTVGDEPTERRLSSRELTLWELVEEAIAARP
jgi:hypothetical protein